MVEKEMVEKAISKLNVVENTLEAWAIDSTGDSIPFGSAIFGDLAGLLEESKMLLKQSMERVGGDITPAA